MSRPAERLDRRRDGRGDLLFDRMSRLDGQGLAARLLHLLGGGVDGARQLGVGGGRLGAMTTLAPSCAARRPIALPIPRLAPVMKRVLPVRERSWSMMAGPFTDGT